jgi:very-short-patch-repair endonuclease
MHENLVHPDADYEFRFANTVLRDVPNLDFVNVYYQVSVERDDGRIAVIDFVIDEGNGARLALEVDGYQKFDRGTREAGLKEHSESLARDRQLTILGFTTVHFSNHDVKHRPAELARQIELILKPSRGVKLSRGEADEYEQLEAQRAIGVEEYWASLQQELGAMREGHAELARSQDAIVRGQERILERMSEVEAKTSVQSSSILNTRQPSAGFARAKILALVAAVLVVAGVAFFVLRDTDGSAMSACPPDGTPWNVATQLADGTRAVVIGPVVGVRQPSALLVNIGAPESDPNRFKIYVPESSLSAMPASLLADISTTGQTVSVSGVVSTYDDVKQIEVTQPDQVTACTTTGG